LVASNPGLKGKGSPRRVKKKEEKESSHVNVVTRERACTEKGRKA